MNDKFSTAAFRSFKTFVGELTAVAAGIYVGIQEVLPSIDGLGLADPWEFVAKKHGIKLCGLKSERVLSSAIRLNLVSLYSGLDLFFSDTRSQYHTLHGKVWVQHVGDTPFMALLRNTASSKELHESRLGLDRITSLDYYRLVRNSIAHPSEEAEAAAKKFYSENRELLISTADAYGMKSVPSQVESLSFHDIKYLARLALDLASAIDRDLDPGDDRLAALLPANILRLPKSKTRLHNARKGWLSVTFGIQSDRAERILSLNKTHKLSG
ncbi:hypothetical protein [Pseudomonas sp. PDM07]|uniref:hypothetical protein n=1 Tax=Pseudomonas sp. PDM07 TaxID=2769264 RepID=UPI00177E5F75|nr:hypothetical protein [Pseudomonas sp. PDM07]MBD9619476.1 hypothetical protein [Pseudomonas sp. PDM07]